jgi:ribosomal 50S subunit-recycling heat shock protein
LAAPPAPVPTDSDLDHQRVDSWLWCARLFKTRSLAARYICEHSVRVRRAGVTHRIDKAAFALRLGDEVTFLRGERLVAVAVAGFARRRVSPAQTGEMFASLAPCTAAATALMESDDASETI